MPTRRNVAQRGRTSSLRNSVKRKQKKRQSRQKGKHGKERTEAVVLLAWRPERCGRTKVRVWGLKVEHNGETTDWRSAAVVQRVSSRVVETASGTRYRLYGPSTVGGAFADGFPRDWFARLMGAT